MLLTLYEFEAKAQLGDSDLSECLDAVEALPHADSSTFESLAGIHYKHFSYYKAFFVSAIILNC